MSGRTQIEVCCTGVWRFQLSFWSCLCHFVSLVAILCLLVALLLCNGMFRNHGIDLFRSLVLIWQTHISSFYSISWNLFSFALLSAVKSFQPISLHIDTFISLVHVSPHNVGNLSLPMNSACCCGLQCYIFFCVRISSFNASCVFIYLWISSVNVFICLAIWYGKFISLLLFLQTIKHIYSHCVCLCGPRC